MGRWRDEGGYRAYANEESEAALPAGVTTAGENV